MTTRANGGIFFAGVFLAGGIALAGFFIGKTMYNAKVAVNTAEVKGLAERRVKADRANWGVNFGNVGASRADVPALYELTEKHQQQIIGLLKAVGFADHEIKVGLIEYNLDELRDKDQRLVEQKHRLLGSISVETDKIELIDKARARVNKLLVSGINISSGQPMYRFTKLNEIKPAMLQEATKNARIAAAEFARNAGVDVGGIRSARQGGFIVRDAGEGYGDTAKIDKDVRVVTTITFYLTD